MPFLANQYFLIGLRAMVKYRQPRRIYVYMNSRPIWKTTALTIQARPVV